MKAITITFTILCSLTSAHASAGGGGHGGGGPKSRSVRAVRSADGKVKDGSPHSALALKTHEENPSLS